MCFSATASFSVAATTAMIGIAAFKHVKRPGDLMVAAVPLLFAAQQAVEGFLWLQLPDGNVPSIAAGLTFTFLIFAEVLWPTYPALAVLSIEPDNRRRVVLSGIAVSGCLLSVYLLGALVNDPPVAVIRGHSIAYPSDVSPLSWQQVPYLLCTCGPSLLSSQKSIRAFGLIVLSGFLVSAYAYYWAFISVWCFFAAAGSSVLYFHFKREAIMANG